MPVLWGAVVGAGVAMLVPGVRGGEGIGEKVVGTSERLNVAGQREVVATWSGMNAFAARNKFTGLKTGHYNGGWREIAKMFQRPNVGNEEKPLEDSGEGESAARLRGRQSDARPRLAISRSA